MWTSDCGFICTEVLNDTFQGGRPLHLIIPYLSRDSGGSLYPHKLSVDLQESCDIYKCRVAGWWHSHSWFSHTAGLLICFCGLGSTPVQGNPILKCIVLQVREETMFICNARIFSRQSSKLENPDRNCFITCIFKFCSLAFFPHIWSTLFLLWCLWACVDCASRYTHAKNIPTTQRPPSYFESTH